MTTRHRLHHADAEPGEAVRLLRQRASALREGAELVGYALERHHERGPTRLVLIEVELAQVQRHFQTEWVERIAQQIESGALEWARPSIVQEVTP